MLAAYHELEPAVQSEDPSRAYREVMTDVTRRIATRARLSDRPRRTARSRGRYRRGLPFPEVPAALDELRRRGWHLAALSNTDPDLIAASSGRLGVPFDEIVTASDAGSYKPALGHWRVFFERTRAARDQHVHVAQSVFHDIAPANARPDDRLDQPAWRARGLRAHPRAAGPREPSRHARRVGGLMRVPRSPEPAASTLSEVLDPDRCCDRSRVRVSRLWRELPGRACPGARAWGDGGEAMADAASLPLPYPEAAIVAADTLAIQNLELAAVLPRRPIVLGGCCCAHVGAVEGLAARGGRLALIWFDAHGDLNTPETSTSGNTWGMPLRMLIDAQTVRLDDVALVGARNLDPPEQAFIQQTGLATGLKGIETALEGVDGVYIALDLDVLDPSSEIEVFSRAGWVQPGGGRDGP